LSIDIRRVASSPRGGAVAWLGASHGGFWRHAFDRTHIGPLATALSAAGFTVATPEYRTGAGGGWPLSTMWRGGTAVPPWSPGLEAPG
jgi:acetyl esterase/lipase